MMTRSLLALTFLASMPVFVLGQSKQSNYSSQPCCGQTESSMQFVSLQEEIQYTRTYIQSYLLNKLKTRQLSQGVHTISSEPSGHKFQAMVGRGGIVTAWYVTDPSGHRIAQINANTGTGDIDVNKCMNEFIADVAIIDGLWKTGISRFEYGRQIWGAWLGFLTCLETQRDGGAAD